MRQRNKGVLNVYLISTSGKNGCFFPVRERIFRILEEKLGLRAIGYERDDYITTDATTLTENCLKNMRGADIFLIILNERYGFIEEGDNRSVTHAEIEAAIASDKPQLIFAQNELLKLCDIEDPDEIEKSLSNFFGNDIEHGRKQIELLKRVKSQQQICNYPQNDDDKICTLVETKMRSFAPYFVNEFVRCQKKNVEDIIKTECFGNDVRRDRLSYTILDSDPEFAEMDMSSKICNLIKNGSVVVEGESGSGKTVTLRTAFVDLCNYYKHNNEWSREPIPLYVEFRSYSSKTFSLRKYVSNYFKQLVSFKIPEFVLDYIVNECGVYIFADALDEWRYSDEYVCLDKMITSLGKHFVLSVRRSTYRRIEERLSTMGHPCMMVTVHGWTKQEVRSYAEHCLGSSAHADVFTDRLIEIMSPHGGYSNYYSPFLVSMAVHHLSLEDGENITSIGHLMRESIRGCILKDLQKRRISITDEIVDASLQYLTYIATFIYITRYENGRYDSTPELEEYLNFRPAALSLEIKKAVRSVFYIFNDRNNRFYPKHLMVVYYFLADMAVKRIKERDFSLFSKYPFTSEVNRMIANLSFDITRNEIEDIIDRACSFSVGLKSETERLLFYHFIPRLADKDQALQERVRVFLNQLPLESMGFSSIAVYNWLAQYGDLKAEKEYFDLIRTDDKFAAWQRGCYLIYKGDRPEQKFGFADDDGEMDWLATATSFIEHFNNIHNRHRFIRRIDIATMISFLNSGKTVYPTFSDYFLSLDEDKLKSDFMFLDMQNKLDHYGIPKDQICDELIDLLRELKEVIRVSMQRQ